MPLYHCSLAESLARGTSETRHGSDAVIYPVNRSDKVLTLPQMHPKHPTFVYSDQHLTHSEESCIRRVFGCAHNYSSSPHKQKKGPRKRAPSLDTLGCKQGDYFFYLPVTSEIK